jgi:hypothetical protein
MDLSDSDNIYDEECDDVSEEYDYDEYDNGFGFNAADLSDESLDLGPIDNVFFNFQSTVEELVK